MTQFLSGFFVGMGALWAFLELVAILMRRQTASVTKHNRQHRDAPERNLSREIQTGMAELNERDGEYRVRYEFLGMADREDQR